jgi:hypothetical protein
MVEFRKDRTDGQHLYKEGRSCYPQGKEQQNLRTDHLTSNNDLFTLTRLSPSSEGVL